MTASPAGRGPPRATVAAGPDRAVRETAQRDGHGGEGMGDLREQDGHVPHPRDVLVAVTGHCCSALPLAAVASSACASSADGTQAHRLFGASCAWAALCAMPAHARGGAPHPPSEATHVVDATAAHMPCSGL